MNAEREDEGVKFGSSWGEYIYREEESMRLAFVLLS